MLRAHHRPRLEEMLRLPLAITPVFRNNLAAESILSPVRSCDVEKIAGSLEPAAPSRCFARGLGVA